MVIFSTKRTLLLIFLRLADFTISRRWRNISLIRVLGRIAAFVGEVADKPAQKTLVAAASK